MTHRSEPLPPRPLTVWIGHSAERRVNLLLIFIHQMFPVALDVFLLQPQCIFFTATITCNFVNPPAVTVYKRISGCNIYQVAIFEARYLL